MTTRARVSIRKVLVIYNPRSGTLLASGEDPAARLKKLFDDRGVEADLHAFDCDALPALIQRAEANSTDAVVVCGGDGSILAVVSALGKSTLPLGLIPGGTMNILARDAGLPGELDAAADVICAGRVRAIDVGLVNGEPFLCNSALGLAPSLARTREKLRAESWLWKWPKVLGHALALLRNYPQLGLRVEVDGKAYRVRTRMLAISNNPLSDTQGPIPPRQTLDAGVLGVYVAKDTSRWVIPRLAARVLAGRWQADPSLDARTGRSIIVSLGRERPISVMNDGEPTQLKAPLHYSVLPRALRVLVPAQHEEKSP